MSSDPLVCARAQADSANQFISEIWAATGQPSIGRIVPWIEELREKAERLQAELAEAKAELIGELHSELALAVACRANRTAAHCERRLAELEAVAAAEKAQSREGGKERGA